MEKLSTLLTVTKIRSNGVNVNLSEIIEKKIDAINKAELFNCEMDISDIMEQIDSILAGNVSEKWMEKFVNVLSE